MEILARPAWYVAFLLFATHQTLQYGLGWRTPYVDAYLDPTLYLPVMLGLWLVERRWLFGAGRLSGLEVVVAGTALAVLGEEGFPRWQSDFVRDWWDYPAYAVGGLWFWFLVNPKAQSDR